MFLVELIEKLSSFWKGFFAAKRDYISQNAQELRQTISQVIETLVSQLREREKSLFESVKLSERVQEKIINFEEEKYQSYLSEAVHVFKECDEYLEK